MSPTTVLTAFLINSPRYQMAKSADGPASAEEPGWNTRWAMSAGGPQGLTSFTNQHKNWDSTHLVPLLCSEYNYCYTTPHSSQSLCGSRGLRFCYCILMWLFNFSSSHLLKNTFNVTREQKNICNIFMLNHIVIQIGLQPQTYIPSCVFVCWFFFCLFFPPPVFVCVWWESLATWHILLTVVFVAL